ncbi:MAG: Na+/H+ antiporter subunit G [Candidatus Omnitrophica bacterium]|jgi:multicomponent Na+:H+ antiporter subunit G|nr:Na+/H+ antiporter subunit G [Candidatus Omnitrophota bacterium]
MIEILAYIFIGVGLCFDILGCIGLVRLPDVYNRLQASTKCVTLGTCGIMFGVFLLEGFNEGGLKAILVIIFLFLTAPTAAHALAKAAYKSGIKLWDKSSVDYYKEAKEFLE